MKQEKIRGIYENGMVHWYRQKGCDWEEDKDFLCSVLENTVKQFKTSVEFLCNVDEKMPMWLLRDRDIALITPLVGAEITKTIVGKDMVDAITRRNEQILNSRSNQQEWKQNMIYDFLQKSTPSVIAKQLNNYVIGQDELTAAVAEFLYYHAMRLANPQLPQRPLLITGPSGSGKTEVWRAVQAIYPNTFKIKIVNGARITQEGWKGNTKTLSFVDEDLADGGIFIIDEFDKLATPQYSSGGDNVSERIQSELLKLLEGEELFFAANKRGRFSSTEVTSKSMGFVLIGAFDKLLHEQERPRYAIGFGRTIAMQPQLNSTKLSDEDLIEFGVIPELVGRISKKCTAKTLSDDDYIKIIKNSNSRVSKLLDVLRQYGAHVEGFISDNEILQLIQTSKSNRTGVRWVSAQIEERILMQINEQGLKMLTHGQQTQQEKCDDSFAF